MKKLFFVSIIIALALPVFAQNNNRTEEQMYYINIPVEKIYFSYEGYIVLYRKGVNQIGTVGIPYDWFTNEQRYAELMKLPRGRDWPSMSIFYRDGEFSHVRLYIHWSRAHTTWGVVPQGRDMSSYFVGPESFSIEFQ